MMQLHVAECIYKKAWQNTASSKWIWTTYLSYIQYFFEKMSWQEIFICFIVNFATEPLKLVIQLIW